MNFTFGFIVFFVSIIIPGILFRRFYFYGEFSKQFNTKDPVLHSIYFSIIPGIILQIFGIIIYSFYTPNELNFYNIFIVFRDLTIDKSDGFTCLTIDFFSSKISLFLYYSIFVFLLSAGLGAGLSRLIRIFNLDKSSKIFRFKNQWYYIFSGEVLYMKKFKEALRVTYDKQNNFIHDICLTYADILVSKEGQERELYTGYVVDYDLNSEDITKLDKIYLIDTYRYKKREYLNFDYKKNELGLKELSTDNSTNSLNSRLQIQIPGDVFILDAQNIININLTFIPSTQKQEEKNSKKQKKYKILQKGIFTTIFLIIILHFFYKSFWLNDTIFELYILKTSFWGKLFFILTFIQLFSLINPVENKDKLLSFENHNYLWELILLILFVVISFFINSDFINLIF